MVRRQTLRTVSTAIAGSIIAAVAACSSPPPDSLLISNVTVIEPRHRTVTRERCVLVHGHRISQVSNCDQPPPAAQVIDGSGRFLLPGFQDMHVHALWDETMYRPFFSDFVAWGITGIRDMASTPDTLRAARRYLARDSVIAPRLLASGPVIDGPDPLMPTHSIAVRNEADARAAIAALAAMDADFVKPYTLLPADAALALFAAAKEQGLPVAGHWPAALPAQDASRSGMASIEHLAVGTGGLCDLSDLPACRHQFGQIAAAGIYATPTLLVRERRSRLNDDAVVSEARVTAMPSVVAADWTARRDQRLQRMSEVEWQAARLQYQQEQRFTTIAAAAGVAILAGTDAGELFIPPGSSLHDELALLVSAGLSEMDALRAATSTAAAFLNRADEATIAAGADADLVLLDANPLEDISHTRSIHAVVLRGRVLDAGRLACLQLPARCKPDGTATVSE